MILDSAMVSQIQYQKHKSHTHTHTLSLSLTHTHTHTHTINWASLVAQTVMVISAMRETRVCSLGRKISWRSEWQSTPVHQKKKKKNKKINWTISKLKTFVL